MTTHRIAIAICAALLLPRTPAPAQGAHPGAATQRGVRAWWNERPPRDVPDARLAGALPLVRVRGNRFIDTAGNALLFRGVSISDPDKIAGQGHWSRDLFVHVRDMGARLVRIPVHPVAWRGRTPAGYLALLDSAVQWCTETGMYVIIDWHSIGNLKAGLFQDPIYDTSPAETYAFWRTIARHFRGHHTPAFYELFNEPTIYRNQLGRIRWDDWKEINEDLIAIVRAFDPDKIPLVAGFDWAYDLTPLRDDPLSAEGIAYVTHPYPQKRTKPWEPKWEEDFGFAADRYPLIATEIGFTAGRGGMADNGDYGRSIVAYLEGRGISWVAWVYDPEWGPPLITSWETQTFTEEGEFFHQAMTGTPAGQKP